MTTKPLLSERFSRHAERRLSERRHLLGARMDGPVAALEAAVGDPDPDLSALARFYLATLPLTDVFDTPAEVLLAYARHALMLRRTVPWCGPEALPEDLFVHYVACPRVNNEPLVDCRGALWEELWPRVRGLSPERAVIEVNYWCAEHATYQASDGRTLSALGVLAGASGRCGEESTLLVSALRAVGIPARQLYAPWWAHCDDNHAWAEAWVGGATADAAVGTATPGTWRYLGACEPEEALDRGWFTAAAGRAPLVMTRLFSDYDLATQDVAARDGSTYLVNVTGSYAPTATLRVCVTDPDGTPAPGATVSVQVLNMADWRPLATLVTDEDGRACLELGLCTVRVRASQGSLAAEATAELSTPDTSVVELALAPVTAPAVDAARWHDLDVHAPADHPARAGVLAPEDADRGRARRAAADDLRRRHVAALDDASAGLSSRASAPRPEDDPSELARILNAARGNAPEIFSFLTADTGADRLALLSSLAEKDLLDATAALLEGHLAAARTNRADALARLLAQGLSPADAERAWERYVLCPRVGLEHLSAWRPALPDALPPELRALVSTDPAAAWERLAGHLDFDAGQHLAKLVGSPLGALASGQASEVTRRTLFVAACRAEGVAARLSPVDGRAEVLLGGGWTCVEGAAVAGVTHTLCLTCGDRAAFGTDWSLARLCPAMQPGGQVLLGFLPLDLWDTELAPDTPAELGLPEGTYRLTSTRRLPNGNQQASELVFLLDGPAEVALRTRTPQPQELLQHIPLPDAGALVPHSGLSLLCFLELAAEPTEHLLNELAESASSLAAADLPVTLVTRERDPDDPTLSRTLATLEAAHVSVTSACDDFSALPERLARRMFANPDALPLTVLLDGPVGIFARGGYAVGTVRLVLTLATVAGRPATTPLS